MLSNQPQPQGSTARVMSFYAMAFVGTAPFGSLLAGALALRFGAPVALLVGGVVCVAGAGAFFARLPALCCLIHPIRVRLEITREVAAGLQGASQKPRPPKGRGAARRRWGNRPTLASHRGLTQQTGGAGCGAGVDLTTRSFKPVQGED
jgi:hypothetical protein